MSVPTPTIDQLRLQFDGTPAAASIDYWLAQTHSQRVTAVNKAIDYACNQLELSKNKKQGLGEDQITVDICNMLITAGFDASHDLNVGGHCDIVIKGKDHFLWLAEAKEHNAYGWLDKGFRQLSTRYSTGVFGQDHGAVIIYCYVADAASMLEKWRTKLIEKNADVTTEKSSDGNPLHFSSLHKHVSSGLPFHVRHKAVSLHWNPTDTLLKTG